MGARDPVCMGPPLLNFGISDELFFQHNEIILRTIAQIHPPTLGQIWLMTSVANDWTWVQLKWKCVTFLSWKCKCWLWKAGGHMRCSIDKCQQSNWRLTIWSVPSSSDHFKEIQSSNYLKEIIQNKLTPGHMWISGVQEDNNNDNLIFFVIFRTLNGPNRDQNKFFDVILKHDKDKCAWKEEGRRKSCPICSYALLNILK